MKEKLQKWENIYELGEEFWKHVFGRVFTIIFEESEDWQWMSKSDLILRSSKDSHAFNRQSNDKEHVESKK